MVKFDECYGCGACISKCNKKAIDLRQNKSGFWIPQVNLEKCCQCGLCEKICPYLNKEEKNSPIKYYAIKNKNIQVRERSSSGGVFYSIAKKVIKENGVVFGTTLDKNLNVKCIKVEEIGDLFLLMGSKYVQSYMGNIFTELIRELKNNRSVLFCGTPCQCAGLKKLLGKDYPNLILVDLICHGVPSPKFFNDYIKYIEKKYENVVESICFRNKIIGYGTQNIKIYFKNKEVKEIIAENDMFYHFFWSQLLNNRMCYSCEFSSSERIGDITIGDYWNIERLDKSFDDGIGVSLVSCNSNNGLELINKVKDELDIIETVFDKCVQPNLSCPTDVPEKYNKFWKRYSGNLSIEFAKLNFKWFLKEALRRNK